MGLCESLHFCLDNADALERRLSLNIYSPTRISIVCAKW